jgi:hypothetical protein
MQKDNFRLFLCKQTDKGQTYVLHDEKTVNGLGKSPVLSFSLWNWHHIYKDIEIKV